MTKIEILEAQAGVVIVRGSVLIDLRWPGKTGRCR